MAIASRLGETYIVLGAPRYEHKGLVMVMVFSETAASKMFTQVRSHRSHSGG